MARFNLFQRLFRRTASPASGSGRSGGVRGFFQRVFGRRSQTPTPDKNATDYVNQQITDKDRLNQQKFDSFSANNPDMQITRAEWDTMVTTLGTMGNTIEKFGYEAFKQLVQDMHDEGVSLDKADMAYVINESLSIMRNSDRPYTQEDAMDLLRERIFNY